jgi:enolase
MEIIMVDARSILDSRGNPTVEVDVYTESVMGRAAVPSGASTGKHEAIELRDKGKAFGGKGVEKAVQNVTKKIGPKLIGMDVRDQRLIDELMIELDGTANKSKLGANAILGCSLAVARTAAYELELPLYQYIGGSNSYYLPVPSMNVINGGEHAGNELDIQEHMILPIGANSFRQAVQMCAEVYHALGNLLKKKYGPGAVNVGDEGGYAPPLVDPEEPFKLIVKAIEDCGYKGKIKMGFDAAASEFYEKGRYHVGGKVYHSGELVGFYKDLIKKFPIISAEDPFAEDDWKGFVEFTQEVGDKIQVVGDDLFVTNPKRLQKGIDMGACNSLLLKVNQIGSLSESIDAAQLAFRNGYSVMVSHRSGETEDDFIADLTVALNTGQLKSGAPCRTDRAVKYNQLLRIEEELGSAGKYAGEKFRNPF